MKGGLSLVEHLAIAALPNTKKEKRQNGGGGPELGVARNFYFGFPAKELSGDKEGQKGPNCEGNQLYQYFPDGERGEQGVLEAANEICRGQEHRNALRGFGQIAHGQSRARKENQG